ncbi:MAG TPA: hypothetical protein VJ617_10095 [Arthrobacter sp.]|nr:hypothetical protein [Arthrobacter sp.]
MGSILFSVLMLAFVFMSIRWLWLKSEPPTDRIIPRWSITKRFYTNREHDRWQEEFDRALRK